MNHRDSIVNYVNTYSPKTDLSQKWFCRHIGITSSKFNDWKRREGKENEYRVLENGFQLEEYELSEIKKYYLQNSDKGYRVCCYEMIDKDIVYTTPSTVYRVLQKAGVLRKWDKKETKKGNGFIQPTKPHEHWHIDISYVKVKGIFYFLICILDGYSRAIVEWDLRYSMQDYDVGIVQQKALEKYPLEKPTYISDNGSQFVSKNFSSFIADNELKHVTTSPYYPQSNGKIERFHKTIKTECIRPQCPISYEDAVRIIDKYIYEYNHERLHSAIGYITPMDMMNNRQDVIKKERVLKVSKRRNERKQLLKKTG